MSRAPTGRAGTAPRAPERSRASARLGLTLRTVLLAPREGFAAAAKAAERRARAGRRPIEGISTYLFTAIGGAALASLWLKAGALFKLRQVCTDQYVAAYIAASLVLGALLALIAQSIWGFVGPSSTSALRGDITRSEARLVWGASALPQIFVLIALLPLDLLIVGTDTFTTRPLDESLSTAWAALSIALAASLAVWSLYLFLRGLEVTSGLSWKRAFAGLVVATVCMFGVVGVFAGGMTFVPARQTASACAGGD